MSLYRRGNVWWFAITIKGNTVRGSCKTSDEQQAKEYHDRIRADMWRGKVMGDKVRRTISDAIDQYLRDHDSKKSYRDDVRSGAWWKERFAQAGLTYLDELTAGGIRKIRDEELGRPGRRGPIKPATVDRKLAFLRSVVRAAAFKWEWIDQPPYVELLNDEEQRERYLEPHEVRRLVDALPQPYSDMALLAVSTGLRQGNVFRLRWTEVNLVGRFARFQAMVMKNGKPFSIPLNDTAMEVIRRWIGRHQEYVFCRADGSPVGDLPSKMWSGVLEKAGLVDVRWHDLRHTWASLMRQAGVSLADLQELGGWQTASMVKRYAHLNVDHQRPQVAVMDQLLGVSRGVQQGTVQILHSRPI